MKVAVVLIKHYECDLVVLQLMVDACVVLSLFA